MRNKILFLTVSETLRNLVIRNKNYEFDFVDDGRKLSAVLQRNLTEKNSPYTLLIIDENIADTNLINSTNLDVISLNKDQKNIEKIHYINKPLHVTDLFGKIEFLIENQQRKILNFDNFSINLEARFMRKNDGSETKITELEAKIIEFFLDENQLEKTKARILQTVWSYKNSDQMTDTGTAEVTINNLRKKLKEFGIDEQINLNFR